MNIWTTAIGILIHILLSARSRFMTLLTSFHYLTFHRRRSHTYSIEMSGNFAGHRWNSFIPMSSSIHLQYGVASLVSDVYAKQLKGRQRMGDVSLVAHHLSHRWTVLSLEFLTKSGILVLLRIRIRLDDVTLQMSSFLVGIRGLSLWCRFSILPFWRNFVLRLYIIHSQAFKCKATCLFIMAEVSIQSTMLRWSTFESGRHPIVEMFIFDSSLFVLLHARIMQCKFRWHMLHMEYWACNWHDFPNVAWQPVDVRKACKMVMKVKLCKPLPIKLILKLLHIWSWKKWIEKNAKLKSHIEC